jgi:hypothetical protein
MAATEKRPPVVTAGASGTSFGQNDGPDGTEHNRKQAAAPFWREALKIHPAADLFPRMPLEELLELGKDIKQHGLQTPIVYSDRDLSGDGVAGPAEYFLIDGISRLDAMETVGLEVELKFDRGGRLQMRVVGLSEEAPVVPDPIYCGGDPYEYVISANIRRRHLTKEQQADRIVAVLAKRTERLNLSQSVTRGEAGRLAGSTKNPLKSAAVAEGAKHDISESTIKRSLAKLKPSTAAGARRGAARPPPRPARQPAAVPPLDSRSWSVAAEKDKKQPVGSPSARERLLSAIGYDDWWHCAPEAFRERARRELLATPSAPAGEIANDLIGAAKDDPMAIPAALKRTPPTDRFGRPRPEPGSLLKGANK